MEPTALPTLLDRLADAHREAVPEGKRLGLADAAFWQLFGEVCAAARDSVPEPLTVAVVVCSSCKRLVRDPELWRGSDAHAGVPWTRTDGFCESCFDALMSKYDAEDGLRP